MRRAKHLLYALTLMCTVLLTDQMKSGLREMFITAEGDILFDDYTEPLPIKKKTNKA